MYYPMPVAELLDRFTIALVKLYYGPGSVKTDAMSQIIKLAPYIDFKPYKQLLIQLFTANKELWILEDQMAEYIKRNNESEIVSTAISIRATNLRRCNIKKEIALIAEETTDAVKYYEQ
jgi:hypothetical protein